MELEQALRALNDAAYAAFKAARPDVADADDRAVLMKMRSLSDRLVDKPRAQPSQ